LSSKDLLVNMHDHGQLPARVVKVEHDGRQHAEDYAAYWQRWNFPCTIHRWDDIIDTKRSSYTDPFPLLPAARGER